MSPMYRSRPTRWEMIVSYNGHSPAEELGFIIEGKYTRDTITNSDPNYGHQLCSRRGLPLLSLGLSPYAISQPTHSLELSVISERDFL